MSLGLFFLLGFTPLKLVTRMFKVVIFISYREHGERVNKYNSIEGRVGSSYLPADGEYLFVCLT